MESYPLEYVLHHVPNMAVWGLSEAKSLALSGGSGKDAQDDASNSLRKALLSVLLAKNNKSVWEAATQKDTAFFHVTLLEQSHAFPPRKSARNIPLQHSELSPLTPGTPLYPDGIMTPAWVQRHKETMPCIVVGFYDLWEQAEANSVDPLGAQKTLNLERERDLILCSEINEKKRNANERGIKYAAVLTVKLSRIDNPHMEERISFIRKNTGLDVKSTLFVLSPAGVDLAQFITTMQRSLYELALAYYRDHDKRIKKKKARLPPLSARAVNNPSNSSASTLPNVTDGQQAKPLPSAGWHLRYEYKLAVFSEFRQDVENAIKHYETAYQLLMELFHLAVSGGVLVPGGGGSAACSFLQPFTARWTEARALADCISLKICKLYLYVNRPVPALQQLEKHLSSCKIFPEFVGPPNMHGMPTVSPGLSRLGNLTGGGSFEYWAWVSTQYRVFGELIELATGKGGLRLPFPPPGSLPSTNTATGQAQQFLNTISNTGMNVLSGGDVPIAVFGPFSATSPSLVVQHAGYYYYIAARCAEERWKRFADAEKASTTAPPAPPSAAVGARTGHYRAGSFSNNAELPSLPFSPLSPPSPAANNTASSIVTERSIDHAISVIELLTKSYEQFKKQRTARMTLFLASEIARVYEQSGRYEMALKFFERIAKTYRKEQWPHILRDVLRWSAQCARTLGRWDIVAECLVELMSERMSAGGSGEEAEREGLVQELMTILRGEGEGMTKGLRVSVDMDQVEGFLRCGVQFKKHSTYVGVAAPFQVMLSAASTKSPATPIRFSEIYVSFSDPRYDHVIIDREAHGVLQEGKVQLIDCAACNREIVDMDGNREIWVTRADLEFKPGMIKVLEGAVVPVDRMDLKLAKVTIVLSSGEGQIALNFKIADRAEDLSTRRKWASVEDGLPRWVMLDGYGEQCSLRVIRRQPSLSIQLQHEPPGYVDEIYRVEVEVINDEKETVEAYLDSEFRASGTDGSDHTSIISDDRGLPVQGDGEGITSAQKGDKNTVSLIPLGTIPGAASVKKCFWLRCTQNAGERVMYNTVHYRSHANNPAGSEKATPVSHPDLFFRKNETVRLPFMWPIECNFSVQKEFLAPFPATEGGVLSLREELKLEITESYTVIVGMRGAGPWDLQIASIDLLSTETPQEGMNVTVTPLTPSRIMQDWNRDTVYNSGYKVTVTKNVVNEDDNIHLGQMLVRWRRKDTAEADPGWVESTLSIPAVPLQRNVISVGIEVPPVIYHATPFTVTYTLHNTSLTAHHLSLTMDLTEGFVFSGYKQTQIRALPLSSIIMTYNCVPLVCGKVNIPKLKVSVIGDGADGQGQEVTDVQIRGATQKGLAHDGGLVAFVRPSIGLP